MFEAHGVPVLAGIVADTPEAVRAAAEEIGPRSGGVVVVKAQVKTGGRGKAGGVKLAHDPQEAADRADLLAAWSVVEEEFGTDGPPSTLLGVAALGYEGQLVEIEAVAALPDG